MNDFFGYAVTFASLCFALAMLFALVRLFYGPAAQDRVLALDTLLHQRHAAAAGARHPLGSPRRTSTWRC